MDYTEAIRFMNSASKKGMILGLERMRTFMGYLGNPQNDLRIVHVVGTNGKGSVSRMLSDVCLEAGLKVGTYSSPMIENMRDHFRLDLDIIDEEQYALTVGILKEAVCKMAADNLETPTLFELETALAFLLFKRNNCDICVIEAGLGGGEDATNIIPSPILCIITGIGYDHMGILGNTLSEIARNKAGIFKKGTKAVCAPLPDEAYEVVCDEADKCGVDITFVNPTRLHDEEYEYPIQRFSYDGIDNIETGLMGTYQITNVMTVIEASRILFNEPDFGRKSADVDEYIRRGIKNAKWPCRFERISDNPFFILDGAHNTDAAIRLRESLETYFSGYRKVFIMGILKDKEYDKICRIMCPLADCVICVSTDMPGRILRADELMEEACKYCDNTVAGTSFAEAVRVAYGESYGSDPAGDNTVIVAFGSLSFLEKIRNEVKQRRT